MSTKEAAPADSAAEITSTASPFLATSARASSPLDLPELVAVIAKFLSTQDLASAIQVSVLFHNTCAPVLWNTVILQGDDADEVWQNSKGFRMGLLRYGRYIERLYLIYTEVQDGDMELIAGNCPRLKFLNLSKTNVTAETLKVLIHSDPYNVMSTTAKKRKRQVISGARRGQGASLQDDGEESGSEHLDTMMDTYRSMTETETGTEQEADHHYESVGLPPSTSTESEQDQQEQSTGPVLATARTTGRSAKSAANSIVPPLIPTHRLAGTTRPAKFKGSKTQFPFHLEELVLTKCINLTGKSCFDVVSLLGPQLKFLAVSHVSDIDDKELVKLMNNCPNLSELHLNGTEITDGFLKTMAGGTENGGAEPRPLEALFVNMTSTTNEGLVPFLSASRYKMKSLSCEHNHEATSETLYALIEDPKKNETLRKELRTKLASTSLTKTERTALIRVSLNPSKRTFTPNNVLTEIRLSFCSKLTDRGLQSLFRYATELEHIELQGCDVGDESLLILAETNRKRMERLGHGVPQEWYDHELGDKRIEAAKQAHKAKKSAEEKGKKGAKASNAVGSTLSATSASAPTTKIYTGGRISGGLQTLNLKNCRNVTNKGLRAIVRSCVSLWGLNLGGCSGVSMRLFRGPWACRLLKDLNISGVCMNLVINDTKFVVEELYEMERFPLEPVDDYDDYQDFLEDGSYDYITPPLEGMSDDDDDDGFVSDSDDEVVEASEKDEATKRGDLKLPKKAHRNRGEQRRTLREVYSKLGQNPELTQLDMSNGDYRIRVQDGLDLVLPALQQNLLRWEMVRYLGYNLQDSEMIWFGKNFGYGHDYTTDADEIKRQEERIAEYEDAPEGQDRNRIGKLQSISLSKFAVEGGNLDPDAHEWFHDQGIGMDLMDDYDMMWAEEDELQDW
ncbi:hypothetical protein EDD21DRAFT_379936 [Dissophora ornata]|nr:hypothetical protein EDD21DRAFT_379936 [Dissophora ornata]